MYVFPYERVKDFMEPRELKELDKITFFYIRNFIEGIIIHELFIKKEKTGYPDDFKLNLYRDCYKSIFMITETFIRKSVKVLQMPHEYRDGYHAKGFLYNGIYITGVIRYGEYRLKPIEQDVIRERLEKNIDVINIDVDLLDLITSHLKVIPYNHLNSDILSDISGLEYLIYVSKTEKIIDNISVIVDDDGIPIKKYKVSPHVDKCKVKEKDLTKKNIDQLYNIRHLFPYNVGCEYSILVYDEDLDLTPEGKSVIYSAFFKTTKEDASILAKNGRSFIFDKRNYVINYPIYNIYINLLLLNDIYTDLIEREVIDGKDKLLRIVALITRKIRTINPTLEDSLLIADLFDHINNPILNQWFNNALKLTLMELWIPSKYILMVDPGINTIIINANMAEDYIQIVYPSRIIEKIDIQKVFPLSQTLSKHFITIDKLLIPYRKDLFFSIWKKVTVKRNITDRVKCILFYKKYLRRNILTRWMGIIERKKRVEDINKTLDDGKSKCLNKKRKQKCLRAWTMSNLLEKEEATSKKSTPSGSPVINKKKKKRNGTDILVDTETVSEVVPEPKSVSLLIPEEIYNKNTLRRYFGMFNVIKTFYKKRFIRKRVKEFHDKARLKLLKHCFTSFKVKSINLYQQLAINIYKRNIFDILKMLNEHSKGYMIKHKSNFTGNVFDFWATIKNRTNILRSKLQRMTAKNKYIILEDAFKRWRFRPCEYDPYSCPCNWGKPCYSKQKKKIEKQKQEIEQQKQEIQQLYQRQKDIQKYYQDQYCCQELQLQEMKHQTMQWQMMQEQAMYQAMPYQARK